MVRVTWDDAQHTREDYDDVIDPEERFTVHACGFLVRSSPRTIVIAQDYHDNINGRRKWRDIDHIPRAMVRKLRYIK